MKNIIYCISLILFSLTATAQIDSHKDSLLSHLKDSLKEVYRNDKFRNLKIEYECDEYMIGNDNDTCMCMACLIGNETKEVNAYEQLQKKYYGMLYSKVSDRLKLLIADDQKKWYIFDNEQTALYWALARQDNEGGNVGSMIGLGIAMEKLLRISKRVGGLFDYLTNHRIDSIDRSLVFSLTPNYINFYYSSENEVIIKETTTLIEEIKKEDVSKTEMNLCIEEINLLSNLAKEINTDSSYRGQIKALERSEKQIRQLISKYYPLLRKTMTFKDRFTFRKEKQEWDAYEKSEMKLLDALEKERNYPKDIKTEFNRVYRRFLASKYRLDLYYKYIARDFNN